MIIEVTVEQMIFYLTMLATVGLILKAYQLFGSSKK